MVKTAAALAGAVTALAVGGKVMAVVAKGRVVWAAVAVAKAEAAGAGVEMLVQQVGRKAMATEVAMEGGSSSRQRRSRCR